MLKSVFSLCVVPITRYVVLLVMLSLIVGCMGAEDPVSVDPIEPGSEIQTSDDMTTSDYQRRVQGSEGGFSWPCPCYTEMDPNNPYTYLDLENGRVFGWLSDGVYNEMYNLAASLNPYDPASIVTYASFSDLIQTEYMCGEGAQNPAIHWQFIDYGWGVLPDEIEILCDGSPVPETDVTILYSTTDDTFNRLVMFYDITYQPSIPPVPGETHIYNLNLYGLSSIYPDSDNDGLVDPAETVTDPYNPDSDGDSLLDGYDICAVKADLDEDGLLDAVDDDADGDGITDPPWVCVGFNDSFSMPAVPVTVVERDYPEVSHYGYLLDAYGNPDTSQFILELAGCIAPEHHTDLTNIMNWTVIREGLTSGAGIGGGPGITYDIPDSVTFNPDDPDSVIIDIGDPIGNDETIGLQFNDPGTPEDDDIGIGGAGNNGGGSSAPCTCPSLIVEPEQWTCCDWASSIRVEVVCNGNDCNHVLTVHHREWDVDPVEGAPDGSGPLNPPVYTEIPSQPYAVPIGCDEFTVLFAPVCKKHEYTITLSCPDDPTGGTTEVVTFEADTSPPVLDAYSFIDDEDFTDGDGCEYEIRASVSDECVFGMNPPNYDLYDIKVNFDNGQSLLFRDKMMTDCSTCLNFFLGGFDPNADVGTLCGCDTSGTCLAADYCKKCVSAHISVCSLCNVTSIEITARDRCLNFTTVILNQVDLQTVTSVDFKWLNPSSPNDWDDPDYKIYTNMPKMHNPSYTGCMEWAYPGNYGPFIAIEAQVTPPIPGVPVVFHTIDPWHRGAPQTNIGNYPASVDPVNNGWNGGRWNSTGMHTGSYGSPADWDPVIDDGIHVPLWDFWEYNTDWMNLAMVNNPDWINRQAAIPFTDPDYWDIAHDNFTMMEFSFQVGDTSAWDAASWENTFATAVTQRASLGSFADICSDLTYGPGSLPYVSYTDCNGVARVRFFPGTYGGYNYKVVADACGTSNWDSTCSCITPAISETIEVWHMAELHISGMENGPGGVTFLDKNSRQQPHFNGDYDPYCYWLKDMLYDCFIYLVTVKTETIGEYSEQVPLIAADNIPESTFNESVDPWYRYQVGGTDYVSAPELHPDYISTGNIQQMVRAQFGFINGLSQIQSWPDWRRCQVHVGLCMDEVLGYDAETDAFHTGREFVECTTAHELCHTMLGLNNTLFPFWSNMYVDTTPVAGNGHPGLADLNSCYGWDGLSSGTQDHILSRRFGPIWGRSLMFYRRNSKFLNPLHIAYARRRLFDRNYSLNWGN